MGNALSNFNSILFMGFDILHNYEGRLSVRLMRLNVNIFVLFTQFSVQSTHCTSEEVILSLLRSKCLTCLLYAVDTCILLSPDKHSFEFTLIRTFMKIFRTGSSTVVTEIQLCFKFYLLPIKLI
jgi:hypothetical protein